MRSVIICFAVSMFSVGGTYRCPDGRIIRHAAAMTDGTPENIETAKQMITERIAFLRDNPDWRPAPPPPPRLSRYVSKGIPRISIEAWGREEPLHYVNKGVYA